MASVLKTTNERVFSMTKQIQRGLLAAGVLLATGAANAAAGDPDVSAVVTAIAAVAGVVALIGAPKLIMKVGVKIWGWISSAI